MTKSALKEKLIGKIREMDNEELLKEIDRLLQFETGARYLLSNEQAQLVREAEEQIKRGEYLTDEAADKEIDEWLDKE